MRSLAKDGKVMGCVAGAAAPLEAARAHIATLIARHPSAAADLRESDGWILRAAESLKIELEPCGDLPAGDEWRALHAMLAHAAELARIAKRRGLGAARAIEDAQRAAEHAERRAQAEHAAEAATPTPPAKAEQLRVGNAVVRIDGDRAEIEVPDYGLESYRTLVTVKAAIPRADADGRVIRCAAADLIALGIVPPSEIGDWVAPAALFEDQAYAVATALRRKRFAIFAEAGWGKTASQLAWALAVHRATGGRVLLVAPLAVVRQTIRELAKHFPDASERIENLRDRKGGIRAWLDDPTGAALAIVNVDVFRKAADLTGLAGLVLDESSILKQASGTIRNNLVRAAQPVPYRLACSATPAPNDLEEYVSHALFLGVIRTHKEFFADYFASDGEGGWTLRGHASAAFYAFMASWSVWMRDPAVFGFAPRLGGIPAPEFHDVRVEATAAQVEAAKAFRKPGHLFLDEVGVVSRAKLAQLSRGFLYEESEDGVRSVRAIESAKPASVVAAVLAHPDERAIVWVQFNEEGRLIREALERAGRVTVLVDGDTSEEARDAACLAINDGAAQALIAKPSALGFGVNLQGASVCVFSGITDSFEQDYQAFRRCFRYGQTKRVHCYYVATEFELPQLTNLRAKRAAWAEQAAAMERAYLEASAADLAIHRRAAPTPPPRIRAELSDADLSALASLSSAVAPAEVSQ